MLARSQQISELIASEGFTEWLELVTAFSEQSCRQWQASSNSLG